jgi:hypothetical protein
MYNSQIAADVRIVSITSTTTAQPIGKLINDTYLAKTPAIVDALMNKEVIRMIITPSADVLINDIHNTTPDTITVASGVSKTFDLLNAHDKLMIKNSATVKVELYLGN